jgi:hypothetical protein
MLMATNLEPEDIREALHYAAAAVREREIPLLSAPGDSWEIKNCWPSRIRRHRHHDRRRSSLYLPERIVKASLKMPNPGFQGERLT